MKEKDPLDRSAGFSRPRMTPTEQSKAAQVGFDELDRGESMDDFDAHIDQLAEEAAQSAQFCTIADATPTNENHLPKIGFEP